MDAAEIRRQVLEELQRIAPELEPEQLRGDRPLRDEVDLDSMDWLRFISALHRRIGGHAEIRQKLGHSFCKAMS
jgi:acyl carrier protein